VNERYGSDVEMSFALRWDEEGSRDQVRFSAATDTEVLSFHLDEEFATRAGRQTDQAERPRRGPRTRADPPTRCSGRRESCARSSPATRPSNTASPPTTRSAMLVVQGVLHLLDYDHAETEEDGRDAPARRAGASRPLRASRRARCSGRRYVGRSAPPETVRLALARLTIANGMTAPRMSAICNRRGRAAYGRFAASYRVENETAFTRVTPSGCAPRRGGRPPGRARDSGCRAPGADVNSILLLLLGVKR